MIVHSQWDRIGGGKLALFRASRRKAFGTERTDAPAEVSFAACNSEKRNIVVGVQTAVSLGIGKIASLDRSAE